MLLRRLARCISTRDGSCDCSGKAGQCSLSFTGFLNKQCSAPVSLGVSNGEL